MGQYVDNDPDVCRQQQGRVNVLRQRMNLLTRGYDKEESGSGQEGLVPFQVWL